MTNKKENKKMNDNQTINDPEYEIIPDSTPPTASRPVLSLRFSTAFWTALGKAMNNPSDIETTESALVRSLFLNWLNSKMQLDEYTVIMNFLATTLRGKYEPVTFPLVPQQRDDTTQRTFTMSLASVEKLNYAKINLSGERNNSDIYYKLILSWIVSRLPLNQYLSLMTNAVKIQNFLRDEIKDIMKDF